MQQLQMYDIYDVWYQPFWQQTWFLVTGIVVVLVLMSAIGYWLYNKQKAEIVLTADEQALVRLYHLQSSTTDSQKQFYSRLTSTLKQYLQERYQLLLSGTTDDEMLTLLKKNKDIPQEVETKIDAILQDVVLIKFADQKTVRGQMDKALKESIALVKETKEKFKSN